MQILLLNTKGVRKLQPGINTVKDGYGRYLIRNKQAITCTMANLQSFNEKLQFYNLEQSNFDSIVGDLCKLLDNKFIFIVSPVNETGNLYGTIRPKKVVEEIKKQLTNHEAINTKDIIVQTINRPGIFEATLVFNKKHSAKIQIIVGHSENVTKEMYLNYIGGNEKSTNKEIDAKNKKNTENFSQNLTNKSEVKKKEKKKSDDSIVKNDEELLNGEK